jgi:hypothetical protein
VVRFQSRRVGFLRIELHVEWFRVLCQNELPFCLWLLVGIAASH